MGAWPRNVRRYNQNCSSAMSFYAGTECSCFLTYCHRNLLQVPSRTSTVVPKFLLHLVGFLMFSGRL
jgi:hypothetical protein